MADLKTGFSASSQQASAVGIGGRLVLAMNSIARRQFLKYKRVRRLKTATTKSPLNGGDGIAFGADPQAGP